LSTPAQSFPQSTAALLQPALQQLAEIAALPRDWDSYGALSPASQALAAAYALLFELHEQFGRQVQERVRPYMIAPIAHGGLQLEWRGKQSQIEVEIAPNGALGYLLIRSMDGERTFCDADNVSLSRMVSLIGDV
jgi:hypothetical protein